MSRYILTIIAAIALCAGLAIAAASEIERAQADYVRAVRGPK